MPDVAEITTTVTGVLEKHANRLSPDVFLLGVYGGNDFYEAVPQLRFFNRLPPPARDQSLEQRIRTLARTERNLAAQALLCICLHDFDGLSQR